MGTPTEVEINSIENPKARAYLRQLPFMPAIPLKRLFPTANPLAIDLLQRMLQFDPKNRCTVEQALSHPYLASLHDPRDEPVCPYPFSFGVNLERARPEMIKEMVFREMLDFHPSHFAELDAMRIQGIARVLPGYQPPVAQLRPIPGYKDMISPALQFAAGQAQEPGGQPAPPPSGDVVMSDQCLQPEEEFQEPPPGTPMTDT